MSASFLRKLFICPTGSCPFVQGEDDTGVWGECTICGKRAGFVSREELRSYAGAFFVSHEWPTRAKLQLIKGGKT